MMSENGRDNQSRDRVFDYRIRLTLELAFCSKAFILFTEIINAQNNMMQNKIHLFVCSLTIICRLGD